MLKKTLESPLDCKEIQPVHLRDQSWIFIERTGAEAETPILWPPDAKSQVTGKDPDPGKDWGQEEKWAAKVEMASSTQWTCVWVNSGSCDGQGGLACCSPWGGRVTRDWGTELNWFKQDSRLYSCSTVRKSDSLISKAFQTQCPFLHLHYSFFLWLSLMHQD